MTTQVCSAFLWQRWRHRAVDVITWWQRSTSRIIKDTVTRTNYHSLQVRYSHHSLVSTTG